MNRDPFYTWVRERCASVSPCTVRMKDYADFDWDRMYVFGPAVMEYEIKDLLGASPDRSGEYAYLVMFFKRNKMVRHFESPIYFDREHLGSIYFEDEPRPGNYLLYNAGAEFQVEKQNETVGVNFLLRCRLCD